MTKVSSFVAFTTVAAMGISSASAAIVITNPGAATPVGIANFSNLTPDRGELAVVSASQQGGVWKDTETNSISTVGSGSTPTPYFELTITNQTGAPITGITIEGQRIQFKDNTANLNETLAATISGISDQTVSGLNVALVSNNGNSQSDGGTLTAAYSASISNFSLADLASFTIRWTDANDGGTDALFGLSNIVVTSSPAVPEPSALGLLGVGAAALLRRRRA